MDLSHYPEATHYEFAFNLTDDTLSYYWLLSFAKGANSVLEIGCSTGFFSRHLVAQGCQVTGIEVNPAAAEKAQTICKRVIIGDVEQAEVQAQVNERFDVVVLGDVLEHLRAPERLLTHIRQHWLQPYGWVVLSVPNSGHWIFRRELLRGRFPYRQYGLFDRTHLRFFSRASLVSMIAESGYKIEQEAVTVNHNSHHDITFAIFTPLYRRRLDFRSWMMKLERQLATYWPTLFAYQFVLKIRPVKPQ